MSETLLAFLQVLVSHDMEMAVGDCKNAFCQSQRLQRKDGRIYVQPCEGLPLGRDILIELVSPVYGLNDAPLLWHRTLTQYLREQGFKRSPMDPCLYLRHRGGLLDAIILIEVDYLLVASRPGGLEDLGNSFKSRFNFW